MIQCKDLPYERYTVEQYREAVIPEIEKIENADSFDTAVRAREKVIEADGKLSTMAAQIGRAHV